MSAPISCLPRLIYDDEQQVCRMETPAQCEASVDLPRESEQQGRRVQLNPSHLAQLASQDMPFRAPSLWQNNPLSYSPLSLPVSLQGCADVPPEAGGLMGDPIASIDPLNSESTQNPSPIAGKVRQLGVSYGSDAAATVAWSVSNTSDLAEHGTYAAVDSAVGTRIAESPTSIPRDTSVARLSNGESIILFSRIEGDDAPSSLVAQRMDASGNSLGSEIEILPSSIRSGFPRGQVLPQTNGFLVVFADGEGNLQQASFDASGVEQGRENLGPAPVDFQITAGEGDAWTLAEIVGPTDVRVRTYNGDTPGAIDHSFTTNPLPSTPRISVAMQDDGAVMVAWNALLDSDDPILQGNFLLPGGEPVGENVIFRDLIQAGAFDAEDHINSHAITTDHRGNFILAFEENRNIIAYVYNGSNRDGISLTDISTRMIPDSGDYADLLSGLSNTSAQNVDVQVSASPDGQLAFVYNKIFTGDDPDSGATLTFQSIIRRDFQINYE